MPALSAGRQRQKEKSFQVYALMYQPSQDRWYQAEAVQSIFDYFNNGGSGNPVLALPTAAGKTHIIANFIKRVLNQWPNQRFIVGTHVKELVQQNADKFGKIWPYAPYGIHSEGLKRRDHMQPIIFGNIQSMLANTPLFGHRDLLIIDEAHLVSPKEGSNYQEFIKALRYTNPNMKVIGLSATIFRQGTGLITSAHEGQIFTDVAYDLCTIEGFARLIAEGYLSRLLPKQPSFQIDTTDIAISNNGEFNQKQLQEATDKERVTYAALTEACHYGQNRRSWLVFASGIEHAEHISTMLNTFGISSTFVHSKISNAERDERINAHKAGNIRCLVGNNIFTTGYDHPPLDYIIDLQPTNSVSKHVQKYGRGMRVSPETGKENCLILDFGGNVRRCGPINDPYIPRGKKKGTGDAPVRLCENCGTYNHASARICDGCGMPFPEQTKFAEVASEAEILKNELPVIEIMSVDSVYYWKHISKKTGMAAMVCSYFSGVSKYDEWVNFENPKARHFAHEWWRQRSNEEPPVTVDEALTRTVGLRIPRLMHVWLNQQFPKVTRVEW